MGSGDRISNRLPQVIVTQPVCGPASPGKPLPQAEGRVPKEGAGLWHPRGKTACRVSLITNAPVIGMAVTTGMGETPVSASVSFTPEGPP